MREGRGGRSGFRSSLEGARREGHGTPFQIASKCSRVSRHLRPQVISSREFLQLITPVNHVPAMYEYWVLQNGIMSQGEVRPSQTDLRSFHHGCLFIPSNRTCTPLLCTSTECYRMTSCSSVTGCGGSITD